MNYRRILPFIIILILLSGMASAQTGRWEKVISDNNWNLWLDRGASWYNDDIYLPPVDVSKLPVNPPTIGWENLHSTSTLANVSVPGTVEQHFWGQIGGATTEGNYVGVSWWSKKFRVDDSQKGKRITLAFQSVNMRAEVFVNGKLVGYDMIGNTPFEVNATEAVVFGQDNQLDVRITDPVGNFSWDDNTLMRWGKNIVPAVHGFGGITGSVIVRATDAVEISDIYIQNQPDPKKVNVIVTLNNYTGSAQKGDLAVTIHEKGKPNVVVWTKTTSASVSGASAIFTVAANVPTAKLWEVTVNKPVHETNLYEVTVTFTSDNKKIVDNNSQRFGFRWFDVGEKDGDKRFYLNGKRVFIIAAMTRGIWPTNGMFPTPVMAKRDMNTMYDLGMNTMLMHRAIGQPGIFNYADSAGLFTYEEPGGSRLEPNLRDSITGPDNQAYKWRSEKLRRMVIRDRSLPSLIIYNLKNESRNPPNDIDIKDVLMVHELDPTRIVTYNSGTNSGIDIVKSSVEYYDGDPKNPLELHMLPLNPALIYGGWWDHHHWYGYSGYTDEMYRNPKFYLRGVVNAPRIPFAIDSIHPLDKKKIIFFGEEGAFSAMVRLQKIAEEIGKTGATGYREQEHLDWFNAYNKFLDETGFRKAYPSVDSLTVSMGRNIHYFQARDLENVRMSNIADAFNSNGWASESTRTDMVDAYRNPTSNASIMRHFTKPLYVAVKLRNKVVSAGSEPISDFFIVNESDLKGKLTLNVALNDPKGTVIFTKAFPVTILGGEEFGQLLVENVKLPVISQGGYYNLKATITDAGGAIKADGFDDIYSVDLNDHAVKITNVAVLESDTTVKNFLSRTKGINAIAYSPEIAATSDIVIGTYDFAKISPAMLTDIFKRVQSGTKLVVLTSADKFAQQIDLLLKTRPTLFIASAPSSSQSFPGGGAPDGRGNPGGIVNVGAGGRLFVGLSSILTGLPQAQGMSWEYQCFYKGAKSEMGDAAQVSGIRLNWLRTELVVALGNAASKEIVSALSNVPVGKGTVTLSTLNMIPNLRNNFPSAIVAKKLFLNMLEY